MLFSTLLSTTVSWTLSVPTHERGVQGQSGLRCVGVGLSGQCPTGGHQGCVHVLLYYQGAEVRLGWTLFDLCAGVAVG